jgi:hypothetical protein
MDRQVVHYGMDLPESVRVKFTFYLTSDDAGQVVIVSTPEYRVLKDELIANYIAENAQGWIGYFNATYDVDDFRKMTDKEIVAYHAGILHPSKEMTSENTDIRH